MITRRVRATRRGESFYFQGRRCALQGGHVEAWTGWADMLEASNQTNNVAVVDGSGEIEWSPSRMQMIANTPSSQTPYGDPRTGRGGSLRGVWSRL